MSPVSDYAVRVNGLTRRFGSFTAVDQISFAVPRGTVFGFLGPNGSGKTTTIRMLCGILTPSGGQGEVAGLDINREYEKIKSHIGYVSQKFSLYQHLSVYENLNFFGGIYGVSDKLLQAHITRTLDMVGLSEYRHQDTRLLSGGWRQRLALACAMVHSPPILFLDEPTSGVDPISRRDFWDLIRRLTRDGTTVFVTTHYLEEAEYCQSLALIFRGRIIAEGSPDDLRRHFCGTVLRIRTTDRIRALEVLKLSAFAEQVALWGEMIQVVVDDRAEGEQALRRLMEDAGLEVTGIEQAQPSLEDVFVSLVEGEKVRKGPRAEVER